MIDIILKIQFNDKVYKAKQKNVWIYSFRKESRNYIIFSILPFLILITGLLLYDTRVFPFIILLGLGFLFYILIKWSGLYKNRKDFSDAVTKYSEKYTRDLLEYTCILSDFGIEYQDKEKLYRLSWPLFEPIVIFRDTIILTLKETGSLFLTIAKDEVGDIDYQHFCNVLKEKLG